MLSIARGTGGAQALYGVGVSRVVGGPLASLVDMRAPAPESTAADVAAAVVVAMETGPATTGFAPAAAMTLPPGDAGAGSPSGMLLLFLRKSVTELPLLYVEYVLCDSSNELSQSARF